LPRIPSEANLRRARQQLSEIKRRIKQRTFVFGETFHDYRYTDELPDAQETGGNYDEFRFFTGLRPSEQIALTVSDCDLVQGMILIDKARVMRQDKDRTKNYASGSITIYQSPLRES
jgi:integrase